MADTVLLHSNRDKAESKATKAAVAFLLLVSAGLVAVVTLRGWSVLQGAHVVSFGYIVVYLLFAWYVARWNRGVLPVAAALAILLAVVAAVAGPAWFARDKAGFHDPALDPAILGLLTLVIVHRPGAADRVRDARLRAAVERRGRGAPRGCRPPQRRAAVGRTIAGGAMVSRREQP